MIQIEEVEILLNEIAEELPKALYNQLNGGIVLLPEVKLSPASQNNDLYILGTYYRDRLMGRYIAIYYGSFMRMYGGLDREGLKAKLRHTLKHEFTHHLESLAGERGLEIQDALYLKDYLNRSKEN